MYVLTLASLFSGKFLHSRHVNQPGVQCFALQTKKGTGLITNLCRYVCYPNHFCSCYRQC